MEMVSRWLERELESHIQPETIVGREHHAIIDLRMKQMEEKLPGIHDVFAGVKVEMAGSVQSETKVGEMDEFDINVVINLPFDSSEVTLNFDNSSPSYASVEVPESTVTTIQERYDIFATRGEIFHLSAGKLEYLVSKAVTLDLNSLNSGGGGGTSGLKQQVDFNPNMFVDIMAFKTEEGWNYFQKKVGFAVDIVPCIHLPLIALEDHPTIMKSIKRITRIFPNLSMENIIRLVPKTSPKFQNVVNIPSGRHSSRIPDIVSDWVLGLGDVENAILKNFEAPALCLMLLKYFTNAHTDLPLWSYYLKTLIIQMVLDKPDEKFWSKQNLFPAFQGCLIILSEAISLMDMYDTFDTRLKLLAVSFLPERESGLFYGNQRDQEEEAEAWMSLTCRKLVNIKTYRVMTNFLKDLLSGLSKALNDGPGDLIHFLSLKVFRFERYGRVWDKLQLSFLDYLIEEDTNIRKENKLKSPQGSSSKGGRIPEPYDWIFNIATEDLRKSWNVERKWVRFTDAVAERESFLHNISLSKFQSELKCFRGFLFQGSTPSSNCTWCGDFFTNKEHILLRCQHTQTFWEQSSDRFPIENREEFERSILSYEHLDLCSHGQNEQVEKKLHMRHVHSLAKSYLLTCQVVGIFPAWVELECQLNAMRYRKTSHDGGYFWTECPIPPPRAHPARIGNYVNMDYEPAWQTCSDDSQVRRRRRGVSQEFLR